MSYKSDMFKINNKSINGQYQFLCDRKLRITWHRQNRKSWSRVRIPRPVPIFHLHIIKIWQMKKNTSMHFEEESIIYIWSKFQLDTCMFDSNILLTKFGPGFWSRVPGVGPGFYSFPYTEKFLWWNDKHIQAHQARCVTVVDLWHTIKS